MITNQLMTRRMGKFSVTQRTKESTKEFITAIIDEEKLKERNHVLLQTRGKKGAKWFCNQWDVLRYAYDRNTYAEPSSYMVELK